MKSGMLAEMIGDIDDDLVAAADVKCTKMKRKTVIKWISGAAAACLVIAGGVLAAPALRERAETRAHGGDSTDSGEIVWEKEYKYAVDAGEFAAYEMGRVIPAEKVGEKLADVSVTAGWVQWDVWEKSEHARGEIYEIKGVPRGTAAAIRFLDPLEAERTDCWYVIIHPEADPAPVREYVIEAWPGTDPEGNLPE